MPHPDAGKERSSRTPLDGHTQIDRLARWKERLGGAAVLISVAWLATNLVLSDQRDFHASRGPVASVHQTWDAQCQACHASFTPISSHSWAPPFLGDLHESTQRCQACHDGPSHHASQKPDLTCGSCHREHRGRDASLVNLPDTDCTQCHKDMSKHAYSAETVKLPEVSRFATDGHPEFSSIKADPGKLKFNHQLHLTAGMALGKDGGAIMTLAKIPAAFRRRYRDQQDKTDDDAPVQLQCASCHRLDSGDFGATASQAKEFPFSRTGQRNAGAYLLPIAYENQCQACHPLTIEPKLAIPHRLPPAEIHGLLDNFFTAQLARGQAGFMEKKVRPLPGKLPDSLDETMREAIAKKVEHAEKDVYLSKRLCAECHYFDKNIVEAIKPGSVPDLRVVPTKVPTVWYQHAKFNHTAHRAVQCAECHAGAASSKTHEDVLIPGRDSCIQCHAPTTKAGTPGARHNCTECHRYHNGDHAGQGIGAATRTPKGLREVEDFLLGK